MRNSFYIDFIEPLPDGNLRLEGYAASGANGIKVRTSAGEFSLKPNGARHRHITPRKDEITVEVLVVEVAIKDIDRIRIVDETHYSMRLYTNRYSGLGNIIGSYARKADLFYRKNRRSISVRRTSRPRAFVYELGFLLRILVNWRVVAAKDALLYDNASFLRRLIKPVFIIGEAIVTIPEAFLLRSLTLLKLADRQHSTWLISDRGMAAGDNGEAFFRHLRERHAEDDREIYFVLSRKSADYERVARQGAVLEPGGFGHKLKFLLADKIISSHADIEVTNPFLRQIDRYIDLYTFDFIFLQHGIIRTDLSDWLNRYEKNITLFVTSARREYDSILKYPYYYSTDNLLLSGLPRYDLLENHPQSKLIIAPTYRKNLLRFGTDKYGTRRYDSDFKKTEYYTFYNRLLTDKRLLAAMQKADMTGEFYIHPNFSAQRRDFIPGNRFTIPDYPYDYPRAFAEGSLLISDYSSVVFDFAYLGKPVVYAQFDIDTFFENHTSRRGDFFSDETDGFGPVTYDYENLIAAIISSIKSGCKMEQKYKQRAEKFFTWHDKNNSERIYKAIISRSGSSV